MLNNRSMKLLTIYITSCIPLHNICKEGKKYHEFQFCRVITSRILYNSMVAPGQSVCNVQVWAKFVYNANPILVYVQHNALQLLRQHGHIFENDGLWSVMMYTSLASSNGGTSLPHEVFPGSQVLYCCNAAQCLIGFCWKMQLGAMLHCLALHHGYDSCHPLPVIIQLQDQCLMHQFPGTGV